MSLITSLKIARIHCKNIIIVVNKIKNKSKKKKQIIVRSEDDNDLNIRRKYCVCISKDRMERYHTFHLNYGTKSSEDLREEGLTNKFPIR